MLSIKTICSCLEADLLLSSSCSSSFPRRTPWYPPPSQPSCCWRTWPGTPWGCPSWHCKSGSPPPEVEIPYSSLSFQDLLPVELSPFDLALPCQLLQLMRRHLGILLPGSISFLKISYPPISYFSTRVIFCLQTVFVRYFNTSSCQTLRSNDKTILNVAIGKNNPFPRSDGQCPSHLWEKRFQPPWRGSHTWGTDKPMFRIDSQVRPHAQNYKSRACTCLRQPMGRKREFRSPAGRPRGQVGGLGEGSASP